MAVNRSDAPDYYHDMAKDAVAGVGVVGLRVALLELRRLGLARRQRVEFGRALERSQRGVAPCPAKVADGERGARRPGHEGGDRR